MVGWSSRIGGALERAERRPRANGGSGYLSTRMNGSVRMNGSAKTNGRTRMNGNRSASGSGSSNGRVFDQMGFRDRS